MRECTWNKATAMRLRMPIWPRSLLGSLLPLLLPSACALCGGACDGVLCAPCRRQFFGPAAARCAQCANRLPQAQSGRCGRCLSKPPAFDATLVAADYAAPLDQLVLQLKFGGRLALAPLLAQLLRDALLKQPELALPDLLCPVPLGRARLAERGFNQALEIARPLAQALGLALEPGLAVRVHETQPQTRIAPSERGRNVAHAFVLAPHKAALVRGRHIGIVDDVMTSGQTLHALSAALKRGGATRVSNFVFARTPPRC